MWLTYARGGKANRFLAIDNSIRGEVSKMVKQTKLGLFAKIQHNALVYKPQRSEICQMYLDEFREEFLSPPMT